MKYPNFNEENKLRRKGYKRIVGLDEAGRGPLAGPVVAAATFVAAAKIKSKKSKIKNLLKEVKDSKKLTPKRREQIYRALEGNPTVEWGTGRVSEKVIDKINILEATKLAMKRAVKNLEKKYSHADFLIIDGNCGINLDVPQKSIIKADEKIFSCVISSIVAKVTRDRTMVGYHKKYPQYGFDKHKGYPTKFHRKRIRKYGLSKIHRKSFRSC
jgi:ribonuclease HII